MDETAGARGFGPLEDACVSGRGERAAVVLLGGQGVRSYRLVAGGSRLVPERTIPTPFAGAAFTRCCFAGEDLLVLADERGAVAAIDCASGRALWRVEAPFGTKGARISSIAAADGAVAVASESEVCLLAAASGAPLSGVFAPPGNGGQPVTNADPVHGDDAGGASRLYFAADGGVTFVVRDTGWHRAPPREIPADDLERYTGISSRDGETDLATLPGSR